MADHGVQKMSDLAPPSPPAPATDLVGDADKLSGAASAKSPLEKDPTISNLRAMVEAQNDKGHEGSVHSIATTLGKYIDASTPDGKFYQGLLQNISDKGLDTKIVPPGNGTHPSLSKAKLGQAGRYSPIDDTMAMYPTSFGSNKNFIHTFTHEAVHAATVDAIGKDPAVAKALSDLIVEAKGSPSAELLKTQDKYGIRNVKKPEELVAEAESNPRLQQFLKTTKSADGRSLWDHYKEVIGGIFGLSGAVIAGPQFEKLMTSTGKQES
jgi:hypothetical protein